MKTIGLIGGMSWESSIEYYRIINETIKVKLGGLHSSKCILHSVDFSEIEIMQKNGNWAKAASTLSEIARYLEMSGANFIILCTNTMHKVADEIQSGIQVPLFHIADATGQEVVKAGIKNIGLLGTSFTMEEDFYKARLSQNFDLNVLIPEDDDRDIVHRIIYQELVNGIILENSRKAFIKIINKLVKNGAEGIILGCTEIGLLVRENDCETPLFDTTKIHAVSAAELSLVE